jgi:hypothetical protein
VGSVGSRKVKKEDFILSDVKTFLSAFDGYTFISTKEILSTFERHLQENNSVSKEYKDVNALVDFCIKNKWLTKPKGKKTFHFNLK